MALTVLLRPFLSLLEDFIKDDACRDAEVERIASPNHRDPDHHVATQLPVARKALAFAAYEQDRRSPVAGRMVIILRSRRRADNGCAMPAGPILEFVEACAHDPLAEDGAHRAAYAAGIVGIHGIAHKN